MRDSFVPLAPAGQVAELGFDTRAAVTLPCDDPPARALSGPIYQGTNFRAHSSEELGRLFARQADGVYTRFANPTLSAVARQIALLEHAESALVFSSGMAAISTALLAAVRPGDHVVSQRQVFAQTFTLLDGMLRGFGVETTFVDSDDPAELVDAVTARTRLVYLESPSNPLLRVVDIEAVAAGLHERQSSAMLLVDNTFATPYLQNPLDLGATLVLHSATKYLGGHSDVLSGAVAGPADLMRRIKDVQILLGGVLDPHAAWLLLRGLRTLALRVRQASANALTLARFLHHQPGVSAVHYPGLPGSASYPVASRQMRAGGAMVSFEVSGGLPAARRFVDALQLIPIATSLGGVETIAEVPYDLDWADGEIPETAGGAVPEGLVRLSVGIENVEDLERDLMRGVASLGDRAGRGAVT